MMALFWAVFVASLFGSLHCAGMCGGLVAVYAGSGTGTTGGRWKSHAAYSVGRLLTYVTLGMMAGAVGGVVDFAGNTAGLHRFATVVAGAAMTTWGLFTLLRFWGYLRLPSVRLLAIQNLYRRLVSAIRGRPPVLRAWFLGFLSALLPCGWLYAFVITAAGTADPLVGGLMMAVFWLGTVPLMVSLGLSLQRVFGVLRSHVPVVTALLLVVVGLYTVFSRSSVILPIDTVNEQVEQRADPIPLQTIGRAATCHDN
ncbi:MAG: sulfite exporter TauE/SafE family protein [Myxococcales bacterium]|nr:sulfite exporter TauE/SafE family protein [Myxococcales bacterium]